MGYEAMVLGRSPLSGELDLTQRDLFLALAKWIPDSTPGTVHENTNGRWSQIDNALRPILTRFTARYLTSTDERGRAVDRVAHFHLGNGAIVERINWLADVSANGLKQSYGIMVNYRYKLGDVDANHAAYANGRIVASREVRAAAKT